MAKVSLDDLRKGSPVARTERTYQLCLRLDLMAEVDALTQEWSSLQIAQAVTEEESRPPKRKGEGGNPRAEEVRKRLAELRDDLEDATGDLRLRAIPDGVWAAWVNEHPVRDGNSRDEQVAFGICDADALADALGMWATSWNGEDLAAGDWDTLFSPSIGGGDRKALVSLVVLMQEVSADPKSHLAGLLGGPRNSDSDHSPAQ